MKIRINQKMVYRALIGASLIMLIAGWRLNYSDMETLGTIQIYIDDNVLFTSDGKVLRPNNTNNIIITGGIFDGETMIYDEQTGSITWQHSIYMPVDSSN